MKNMVVFIEKWGCERVKEGWKGLLFCPPPAASRACQPCLVSLCWKKDKKNKCRNGSRDTVTASTRIKFFSVVRHSILGNLKHFFFLLFSTYLFWPYIVEHAWAEKLIFLTFQKYFWQAWVRYNPMYACTFKLTRIRNVKTSISDNFLVCGPIWVYDASFWSYWPKDSFKIILGLIICLEKNRAETLKMHGFPCRNAQSPNWVQVVSLWSRWPKDSCECSFMSIGCP